jgi:hypothetical protein
MPDNVNRKPRSGSAQHTIRASDGRYIRLRLTRKLAMAALCTECLGFEENPADCTAKTCPMYPFRAKTGRTRRGTIDRVTPDQDSGPVKATDI